MTGVGGGAEWLPWVFQAAWRPCSEDIYFNLLFNPFSPHEVQHSQQYYSPRLAACCFDEAQMELVKHTMKVHHKVSDFDIWPLFETGAQYQEVVESPAQTKSE